MRTKTFRVGDTVRTAYDLTPRKILGFEGETPNCVACLTHNKKYLVCNLMMVEPYEPDPLYYAPYHDKPDKSLLGKFFTKFPTNRNTKNWISDYASAEVLDNILKALPPGLTVPLRLAPKNIYSYVAEIVQDYDKTTLVLAKFIFARNFRDIADKLGIRESITEIVAHEVGHLLVEQKFAGEDVRDVSSQLVNWVRKLTGVNWWELKPWSSTDYRGSSVHEAVADCYARPTTEPAKKIANALGKES